MVRSCGGVEPLSNGFGAISVCVYSAGVMGCSQGEMKSNPMKLKGYVGRKDDNLH